MKSITNLPIFACIFAFSFLFLVDSSPLLAQSRDNVSLIAAKIHSDVPQSDRTIDSFSFRVENDRLIIDFEIPFSGMIDFELKTLSGDRIYYTNYYKSRGKNQLVLNISSLDPQKEYHFSFSYKDNPPLVEAFALN